MARRKLTNVKKALFLERLAQSPYITVCAASPDVEVSADTIRREMQRNPEFAEAVKDTRLHALDRMAHEVHRYAISNGTFEQRLRYLQSVHPMFKKQELDVNLHTKRKGKRTGQ